VAIENFPFGIEEEEGRRRKMRKGKERRKEGKGEIPMQVFESLTFS
jgi:hypothetical protein